MCPSDLPEQDSATAERETQSGFAQSTIEHLLFDFSPNAVVVADDKGMIRHANPRVAELFGYAIDELLGHPVEMLIPERFRAGHPARRGVDRATLQERQAGAVIELFGLRKDGSEFAIDVMIKRVATESGPALMSFIRDATAQRAAQEALRESEQRLRSILDNITEYAIFLLNNEGDIQTWNPGAEQIKGYPAEEVLGTNYSRFFLEEDVSRGRPAALLRQAAKLGRVEEEGWRVRKDGSRFWANVVLTAIRDASGTVAGFAKITHDETDRRLAQESVIAELSNALVANVDIRKMLGALSAGAQRVVAHDFAILALYDETINRMRVQFLATEDATHGELLIDPDASPAGQAFRTRRPVILNRIARWPFAPESVVHLTTAGMQSAVWVPLIHRERTLGSLAVARRPENAFTPQDAEKLGQVAGQVAMAVNNALAYRQITELSDRLKQEKKYLEEEINLDNRFEDIVGESSGLRSVLRQLETVAPTDATVLVQGETGTGKELLARAIHRLSPRSERTFIKLNCAAIPAGLLESELFGHEKGAFTGAIARKIGRLELAHEGTLFLDEVGELPLDLQPKLLRALQEREIERLGSTRTIPVNARLIAATNRDLAKMVAEKQFRDDLYYRLKVFPIFAPPLRERASDIPVLVRHFVSLHSRRMGKSIETIPDEAMRALIRWRWPGNIRELENFLERAVILSRGPVLHVPLAEIEMADEQEEEDESGGSNPTLEAAEREHILRALREAKGMIGSSTGAAMRLGLKRTTLNSKIKKLGIKRSDYM
ncbi:MAG TPA: sigma 54-interacting transcriptional regulator [Acidobacteriaceae bacterium]|jgi:PAS domain S-box-containing protein|nr:sigma 54-interacting transcriptional regulator [Acidobacteriaceae bacterium]